MSFVLEAGQPIGGRYVLERLVGTGGMGQVWAGQDSTEQRSVALKFLKDDRLEPEMRRRMLKEARASCAVAHPSVVPVIDVVESESGHLALVMELLRGESLADRPKPMTLNETARVLLPIADALRAAHEVGIVHRDVKPDNIFLTESGEVKILDFGIAKRTEVDASVAASTGTQTGSIVGTPQFMSPEQAFAERDIDHRSDIWSLGLVLFECLTGVLPTKAESLGQVFKIILSSGIPSIAEHAPTLPTALVKLVDKMLQRDRLGRPQSMAEVVETLASTIKDVSASGDGFVVRVGDSDSNDAWGETQAPAQSNSALSNDSADSFLRQIAAVPASGPQLEPNRSGQRISHYEVKSKIGQGGMGIVYAAEDVRLHRLVALKVLPIGLVTNEGRRRRFLREARSASAVQHANVATVFDVGESEGTVYIAMEHVEGQTLRALLKAEGGALDARRALDIAMQMAKGLTRAHQAGVIHRDVKPENVMITPDGGVKLLDFGLAKLARTAEEVAAHNTEASVDELASHVGRVLGTPAYMSPEQAAGGAVDARTDVYAMGIVLHELLVGVRPAKRRTSADAKLKSRVSPSLMRVIDRCLREEPGERYATARELAADLALIHARPDAGPRRMVLIGLLSAPLLMATAWWALSREQNGQPAAGLANVPTDESTRPATETVRALPSASEAVDATSAPRRAPSALTSASSEVAVLGTASVSPRVGSQTAVGTPIASASPRPSAKPTPSASSYIYEDR